MHFTCYICVTINPDGFCIATNCQNFTAVCLLMKVDDEYNGSSVEPLRRLTMYRINSTRKIFHELIIPSSRSNYQKQVAVLCRIIL